MDPWPVPPEVRSYFIANGSHSVDFSAVFGISSLGVEPNRGKDSGLALGRARATIIMPFGDPFPQETDRKRRVTEEVGVKKESAHASFAVIHKRNNAKTTAIGGP